MINNDKLKLNDIVCSKNTLTNDLTTTPTIDEKQKEDTQCHPKPTTQLHRLTPGELYRIDRLQFNKNYIMTSCPYCGHTHPLSRYLYRKMEAQIRKEWSRLLRDSMTPEQIKNRNIKGGVRRAIKAGQKLKTSTIEKCTGRQILI